MSKEELCIRACTYAILKLTERGSTAFGISKEFVTDDGCIEQKFITINWSEVLDWLVEKEKVIEHE